MRRIPLEQLHEQAQRLGGRDPCRHRSASASAASAYVGTESSAATSSASASAVRPRGDKQPRELVPHDGQVARPAPAHRGRPRPPRHVAGVRDVADPLADIGPVWRHGSAPLTARSALPRDRACRPARRATRSRASTSRDAAASNLFGERPRVSASTQRDERAHLAASGARGDRHPSRRASRYRSSASP